jgi:hypothetical protein
MDGVGPAMQAPGPDSPLAYAGGPQCFPQGMSPGCCPPATRWIVTADAVTLWRPRPSSRPLAETFVTGEEVLNARDASSNWGVGPRIDAIWAFHTDWQIETVYFGVFGWETSHSVDGIGLLVPSISDQLLFDRVTEKLEADLNSVEFNIRRWIGPRVTLLAGVRYLEFRDKVTLEGLDNTAPSTASVTSKVENGLFGLQLGANVTFAQWRSRFYLDGMFKAGVYHNVADRRFEWSGLGIAPTRGAHEDNVACVAEVAALPTYQFSKHCSVYGGYEALWMQGIALAPDQFSAMTGPLHAGRNVLYHGARLGMEVRF